MRQLEPSLWQSGQGSIAEVEFDVRSRDDIPQLLRGLQHLYTTPGLRTEVFQVLDEMIPKQIDRTTGRPGMVLWRILVLGVLRLNLNWDYDRLHEMANQHRTIRQMLGHGIEDDGEMYQAQTLKDNVCLLTPEILDRINQIVVKAGHQVVKKKETEALSGRCDSFVVETNVHYPTDTNLLFDALRKVISLSAQASKDYALSGWGKAAYHLRQIKRLFRHTQKVKPSSSSNEKKQAQREKEREKAYSEYLTQAYKLVQRGQETLCHLQNMAEASVSVRGELASFLDHAKRQMDQIQRRVLGGEAIPHNEKVFSLFEPHTEWLSKGKAGVPVELGLNTCIMEDQYGFILHHMIMVGQTDETVAVPMVEKTQNRFPQLKRCSFDTGFYTPDNLIHLQSLLDLLVLPVKGMPSQDQAAFEASDVFLKARRQHAAVESAINAIEVHGLDRCPDHGLDAFDRQDQKV
jgi:hypothetical protein